MSEKVELGTISSRGQVSIPADIREEMGLKEGSRVVFFCSGDTLLVKKITTESFAEITKPLKEAAKKAGLKEEDVNEMIHRYRKNKRAENR